MNEKEFTNKINSLIYSLNSNCSSKFIQSNIQEISIIISEYGHLYLKLDNIYQWVTYLYVNCIKQKETSSAFKAFAIFCRSLCISYNNTVNKISEGADQVYIKSTTPKNSQKTLFIIDTDAWLGHLQILYSFIEVLNNEERKKIQIISLNGSHNSTFAQKLKPLNIKYFCVNSRLSISQKYDVLISHVNSIKQTGKFSVRSVWLTWPPIVFLGGLKKISDVQISWHMKYPFSLGHSYDYCLYPYGLNSNDATFNLHDQFEPIISHKFYLTDSALQSEGNTEGQGLARTLINKIKSRQLQVVLSVARPEKLNNLKFLHSLKILLSSNPRLCFCWCGKKTDAAVSQLLKKFLKLEIKNQFFLGWVDSWEAVSECDYFIDSYPFGSGITLAQALRLQVIIVFSSEKNIINFS